MFKDCCDSHGEYGGSHKELRSTVLRLFNSITIPQMKQRLNLDLGQH